MTLINDHVRAIESHLSAIADIFGTPDAAKFNANVAFLPAFERAMNLKTGIDAAIAYAAEQARAGDRVGSSRTVDYLIKELGLSFNAAQARLRLGQQNHGRVTLPEPVPPPEPAPVPEPDPGDAGDLGAEERRRRLRAEAEAAAQAAAAAQAQWERERAEQLAKEEAARTRARERMRHSGVSKEKLDLITRELEQLNDDASSGKHALYGLSVEQAEHRSPEDLRDWVRTQVARANRGSRDPLASWKKRELKIGRPDADGGARIYGYITGDTLALLETALAPASRPGHLIEDPTVKDTRTLPQRRHDGFHAILMNHSAATVARTGVGSVVISMSAKDIDQLSDPTVDHRFPTNTNAVLSPVEILRLGAARYGFVVVHDPETGDPLHVGRTKRLATIEQRMALLAAQLVCTNPGCTQPFCNCDVHHLKAWQLGGMTDIFNLAALCRTHHGDNNDRRDGSGARGHAERDPVTGRVGYRPPPRPGNPDPAVEVNDTDRQEQSGGSKVRAQPWPMRASAGRDREGPDLSGAPPGPGSPATATGGAASDDTSGPAVPATGVTEGGGAAPPSQPSLFPLDDVA
ncbi:DUF222 domain-containing protein [Corynebacterium sp. A21]|uniref:DUF222 domain-containing protein n=1 Tax=Corynebacterium sp. A21 TaxID=3457318 RepID=UPI003FD21144